MHLYPHSKEDLRGIWYSGTMKTKSFDYVLPESLIASSPLDKRDTSRLLVWNRASETIEHSHFNSIIDRLGPGDVLVLNDTKVVKARIWARRETGGEIEILLVTPLASGDWEVMLRSAKRLKVGETLNICEGCTTTFLGATADGLYKLSFELDRDIFSLLQDVGQLPLPPYMKVKKKEANQFESQYQTVFAQREGAIAAPTAGLHFTEALLERLVEKGVQIERITLHVGYGTFKPITVENIEDHDIHEERYSISPETAERLNAAMGQKRIVAVGTTVVRTLETAFKHGKIESGDGNSKLYITPGYTFSVVNALLTNFHLPQSSLLLLVSALIGVDTLQEVYQQAIAEQYRFYSFGDAMFIT